MDSWRSLQEVLRRFFQGSPEKGSQGVPKATQGVPTASQSVPIASQGVPKASPGLPKDSPRRLKAWTVDTREALLFFLNYELQVSVRIMIVSHGPVHSGSVHCDTRWALCE